jgi:RNA polymerase sigma-70 factor (ECF subfamily)
MAVEVNPNDEELVRRCQSGDFAAFEELYKRYQRPILAYIYQIVRNYDEAGSIAQDVFLKVFEHVASFDVTRRFSTWFYTIARNAAIDYLQSRSRKAMVSFTDLDRDDEANSMAATAAAPPALVEKSMAAGEAKVRLAAALAELPQMYREIIELVVFQDRTYEEASAILGGVSLGTLRSRMFHALRRLRDRIEREGGVKFEDLL